MATVSEEECATRMRDCPGMHAWSTKTMITLLVAVAVGFGGLIAVDTASSIDRSAIRQKQVDHDSIHSMYDKHSEEQTRELKQRLERIEDKLDTLLMDRPERNP